LTIGFKLSDEVLLAIESEGDTESEGDIVEIFWGDAV
jgi:hypothetical protein